MFKHGILSRYPVVFAAKTGSASPGNRVVFLDGYAGRGEYDDGQPGSPLPLSRAADWWQGEFAAVRNEEDDERASHTAMRVGEIYNQRLTAGTRYKAISMPVRPRPHLLPKYVLVLLTTSPQGAWHFADSLGKAGVEWSAAWQKALEEREGPSLFSILGELEPETYARNHADAWQRIIYKNLDGMLGNGSAFKPADRVPEVYGGALGQASTRHVRAAVKMLRHDGKVSHDGKGDFWLDVLRRC